MKIVIILTMIVAVHAQRLFSQSNNFTVTYNKINTEYTCLYNDNDTIHIAGIGLPYLQSDFRYLHSVYYPTNKLIHSIEFSDSFTSNLVRGINLIKRNNNYVSTSWSAVNNDSFNKCIVVTDRLGKLVKKSEKGMSGKIWFYYHQIYQISPNRYILNAYVNFRKSSYPFYNYLIYSLDSNFNTIDSIFADSFNYTKRYDNKESGLAPSGINRYRLIVYNYKFNCDYKKSYYEAQVVDVDTNLKVIQSKPIPNIKAYIANSLYLDKNRTIIYGENLDTNICLPGFQVALGRPYIAMIDSNLNTSWDIHIGKDSGAWMNYVVNHGINKVIQLKDGNFLAVGGYYYPIAGYSPNSKIKPNPWGGLMLKFDRIGKIIWSKNVRYDDYDSVCPESEFSLRDVTELNNGNLLAVGIVYHSCDKRDTTIGTQRGWIIKTDNQGNVLKDSSHSNILIQNLVNNYSIYPNPTNSFITIKNNIISSKKIILEIYNMQGQKVFTHNEDAKSEIKVSCENLKSGYYLIAINDGLIRHNFKILIE